MKTLKTERLILRKFEKDDAKMMFQAWASDVNCTAFLSWEAHKNIDETQVIINSWLEKYNDENFCNWALELKQSQEIIGNVEVVRYHKKLNGAEIGYCLGSKYWGNGYMLEAIKEIINYLFKTFDLIIIKCNPNNLKSEKLALRLGFEFIQMEDNLKVYYLKNTVKGVNYART